MPVFVQRTALKQTLHIVLVRGTLGVYGNLISLRLDKSFLSSGGQDRLEHMDMCAWKFLRGNLACGQ